MTVAGVRRLRDVRMADVAEVGGKAASLGELLAAGVRVPDGVVLTADAAAMTADERRSLLWVGAGDLGDRPLRGPLERNRRGRRGAVVCGHVRVGAGRRRRRAPRRPPIDAWPARDSARAAEYEPDGDGRMAVIIQRMVAPAAAGVALTADPINGDRALLRRHRRSRHRGSAGVRGGHR